MDEGRRDKIQILVHRGSTLKGYLISQPIWEKEHCQDAMVWLLQTTLDDVPEEFDTCAQSSKRTLCISTPIQLSSDEEEQPAPSLSRAEMSAIMLSMNAQGVTCSPGGDTHPCTG